MKTEIKTYGNEELLNLYKIAFFCSRRCPAHTRQIFKVLEAVTFNLLFL